MKNLTISLSVLLLLLAPGRGLADTIISINIAGGNQDAPGMGGGAGEGIVTGNAGIGQLGNWNNAIGTSGTIPVTNSDGNPSGALVTWSTNNTWSTSTADGAGTDADMLSGYLDNFNTNGSIVVDGLGLEFTDNGYEVLVYFQNDNDDNTGGFTATDNLANTDTRYGHQDIANNNWPLVGPGADPNGYIVSTDTDPGTLTPSNVVRLTGLSGSSFTLTGVAGVGPASVRARPNAIQIITTGDPVDGDMDTLADSWEVANGLSPTDDGSVDINNGPDGDPDMDLSLNRDEFARGTDPQEPDTDMDGLNDNVETNTNIFVSADDTGSDPLNPDSDGDTLEDGAEVNGSPFDSDPNLADTDGDNLRDDFELAANPYVTDPGNADTDNDTWADNIELQFGTDPTDDQSVPELDSAPRIGINFSSSRDNAGELLPTEMAGITEFAHGNWNNFINISADGPNLSGDQTGIVSPNAGEVSQDDGSTLTDVTVRWSAQNSWSTNNGVTTPDNKLMNGYLDNNADNPELVQVDVGNLPASYTAGSGYTVIVYFGSDGNGRTGTIGVVGSETYSFSTSSQQGGAFPGAYVQTTDTAAGNPASNFARWDGLTATDLQIRMVRVGGNCGIHGVQVISTQAATPLVITDIAYDEDINMVALTWDSLAGVIYAIDQSPDLASWPFEINDSIVADGASTTETFAGPTDGSTRVFYRVRVVE